MTIIKSMIIAFAMYSKIPMPKVEWKESDMKYALCFFPLVGAVEGGILYLVWRLISITRMGDMPSAAILTVLTIVITGGIHTDGFLDTMDALSSYQSKERKLEILRDSHTGAFAIIGGIAYYILYFGGIGELQTRQQWALLFIGFILSRTLSGLAMVFFKGARTDGLMYAFASAAHKNRTRTCLCFTLVLSIGLLFYIQLFGACLIVIAAFLSFLYYRWMSYKQFGGITGDLAGYFLLLCEVFILYAVVFATK